MSPRATIRVPDIGDFDKVDVVEVLIAVDDRIEAEASLITLESDKASLEVPSPMGGVVREVFVKVGDQVGEGDPICTLEAEAAGKDEAEPAAAPASKAPAEEEPTVPAERELAPPKAPPAAPHASPAVRRLARELNIELSQVPGSGRKSRITKADLFQWARKSHSAAGSGLSLPEIPAIDFSKFGEIESAPLNRIRKLAASSVHRNWLVIPHVTQFDQADVTELESFRKGLAAEAQSRGVKISPLAFLIQACCAALKAFPRFNSSLDSTGENLILKKYINIGIAVDTPNGLVVPVVRGAERMGAFELAEALAALSERARAGKPKLDDFQGASFTISSLGGIGGTAFTPIINAPEVAILGVSRLETKPVWRETEFVPRKMLPLSLSYDHRVIDGADAARFTAFLGQTLADVRRLLL